ncbi:MAG: helix-turn-helix domain-containing protein [Proteobacteria bacterium]|nr:helix-turn-helix domain-containing protein [Pseudomonadota bacterium]
MSSAPPTDRAGGSAEGERAGGSAEASGLTAGECEDDPSQDCDGPGGDATTAQVPGLARPRIIAIAGGKGGVGCSVIASSIAIYLAQLSKRVVLVDANLGAPNLHTLVGVHEPQRSLHRFLRHDARRLEEMVCDTPFKGLGLVPGQANALDAANPRPVQKKRFLSQLPTLTADYVVVDVGPGTGFNTIDTLLAADLHVLVTHPEPTATECLARLIKATYLRQIRALPGVDVLLRAVEDDAHCGLPSPNQLREAAAARGDTLADALATAMSELRPLIVVNDTRTRDDLELGPALATVARRHLGLPVEYLGHVESDDLVWLCIRKRRPLLVENPEAKVSRDIERVARRLIAREPRERGALSDPLPVPLDRQNHYELLGVHPVASEEELRRAHRQVRRIYEPASSAVYGLAPPEETRRFLQRAEEAYATLIDPEKQQRYNQQLFPEGEAHDSTLPPALDRGEDARFDTMPANETPGRARPEMPLLARDTVFTGELLRQVREARGADLQDLADRTKISRSYLQGIEAEHFAGGLAPVYVRGFVKAVARQLGLDPALVADSYMTHYTAASDTAASDRKR